MILTIPRLVLNFTFEKFYFECLIQTAHKYLSLI